MAKVYTGKVVIPGDKIEEYFKVMEEAEKAREPFKKDLEKINEEFFSYLVNEKKLTERTANKHSGIIDMFIEFLTKQTDVKKLEEVTKGMVNTYFKNWYKRKVLDSRTSDDLKTALNKFFNFLAEKKKIVNINVLSQYNLKPLKSEKDEQLCNDVIKIAMEKNNALNFTEEDKKLIQKLWSSYYKKKQKISGKINSLAAAVLWQYSRMNYLWENDKAWTKQSLSELFGASGSTIGNKAAKIAQLLKIKLWDDRFCRKEVSEGNPMKNMVVLPSGMIVSRDMAAEEDIPFAPLRKSKEDYYYDGIDYWECGKNDKALRCFKKALETDDEYVDAYNGLGNVYFWENPAKAKEYFQKAYDLALKHFKNKWPEQIEWGIIENRQYLRAVHCLGLMLWREGKNNEAMEMFNLMLKLNKNDNQGARYLVAAIYEGLTWEKMEDFDENNDRLEGLFEKQNKIHNFYSYENEQF